MTITAELRDWQSGQVFIGRIYNDTRNRWPDGRMIRTSMVVSTNDQGDHILVKTLNSVYKCEKKYRAQGT